MLPEFVVMKPLVQPGPCDLGFGLFVKETVPAGTLLFSFSGPIIDFETADAKGEATGNPLQIGPNKYIDCEPPGVFINHSCVPNAGIRNDVDVFALRDLEQGSEIRFDYSTSMSERSFTMLCRCGADSCRRVVTDFHDLPEPLQRCYLDLKIVQSFIVAECESRGKSA